MTSLFTRGDAIASIVIGIAIASILPIITRNIEVVIPYEGLLIIIFPILTLIGMYIASRLVRFVPFIYQAAKFMVVGVLNTVVDFGVANLLIVLTGIAVGLEVTAFKAIAFLVALINSYFWNKFWTFRKKEGGGVGEFSQFLLVSVVGFGINVGTAFFVINIISPVANLSPAQWANIGFLSATFLSLTWNFLGYKFWVFKWK